MAYADVTSTILLLPSLPQTSTSSGYTNTSTRLSSHLDRATNIINSKVSRRYDVSSFTSTAWPPLLVTLCQDVASYFFFRSVYSGDNQNLNEWTDKFNDAMDILDEIKKGEADLVDSSGNLIDERSDSDTDYVESNTMDYQSFFDEDSSLDWKVDADKLDNIAGNR